MRRLNDAGNHAITSPNGRNSKHDHVEHQKDRAEQRVAGDAGRQWSQISRAQQADHDARGKVFRWTRVLIWLQQINGIDLRERGRRPCE